MAGITLNNSQIVRKRVYDILGIVPDSIPLDDADTLKALSDETTLESFEDFVRVIGIKYGSGKYYENIFNIMEQNRIQLKDAIVFREDIFIILLNDGYEDAEAFSIMDKVRKGLGITKNQYNKMLSFGIPKWFADACMAIDYAPARSDYEGLAFIRPVEYNVNIICALEAKYGLYDCESGSEEMEHFTEKSTNIVFRT